MGMNMDQYTAEFTAKGIDGKHLGELDSSKLKVQIHLWHHLPYNMQTYRVLNEMQRFVIILL